MVRDRLRLGLALVLLAGLGAATPARAEAPALAGLNTVVGSSVTKMTVTVPRFSTFSFTPLVVDGPGRYVGIALAKDSNFVVRYRANLCAEQGCDAEGKSVQRTYLRRGSSLDPGTYTLFLIADGAPVTVQFELTGLPGAATFTPTEDGGTLFADSNDRTFVQGGEVHPKWGIGADVRAADDAPAYWLAGLAYHSAVPHARIEWTCRYPGGAPSSSSDPYSPGCPGHDLDGRTRSPGWCDPVLGGAVGSLPASADVLPGSHVSDCGDVLPAGDSVGVGKAVVTPTAEIVQGFVIKLQS